MKNSLLTGIYLLTVPPLMALSPMYGPHDLVAGEGSEGFLDGPFYSALFKHPKGLALNDAGNLLYVADADNHAIRVIDLSDKDRVSTLCGTGRPGSQDGPVSTATFNQPGPLAFLPGRGLAVADIGGGSIRLVDSGKGAVSTLLAAAGTGPGAVWAMGPSPAGDSLYFTQPDAGTLKALDLKTGKVTVLLSKDKDLPHPAALCAAAKGLFVSDRDNGDTWLLGDIKKHKREHVAKGPKVVALAFSDGGLYALQADGDTPVAQFSPQNRPVRSLTAWGGLQANPAGILKMGPPSAGFAMLGDPFSPRKFFVADPLDDVVLSFRDLHYGELQKNESINSGGLMDFEYPAAKSPRTFRILLVGDSHLFHEDFIDQEILNDRMQLAAKQMELELNTLASLRDGPSHFEVLTLSEVGWNPLNTWPYYRVPPVVRQYDVDLVLLLLTENFSLDNYYEDPPAGDGIPAENADPEYLLRPWKDRVPQGPAARLVALCQSRQWVQVDNNNLEFDYGKMAQDPEAGKLMVGMYSAPLSLLARKTAAMAADLGHPVGFTLCLMPHPRFRGGDPFAGHWASVGKAVGAPCIDLGPPLTALRPTYYPFSEIKANDHLDTNGHLLVGSLLVEELIERGMVPGGKSTPEGARPPGGPAP